MYKLICQKTAQFLSAQMDWLTTFFQMFIVFGMYHFEARQTFVPKNTIKKAYYNGFLSENDTVQR